MSYRDTSISPLEKGVNAKFIDPFDGFGHSAKFSKEFSLRANAPSIVITPPLISLKYYLKK